MLRFAETVKLAQILLISQNPIYVSVLNLSSDVIGINKIAEVEFDSMGRGIRDLDEQNLQISKFISQIVFQK